MIAVIPLKDRLSAMCGIAIDEIVCYFSVNLNDFG
jgi:hypothetical protein